MKAPPEVTSPAPAPLRRPAAVPTVRSPPVPRRSNKEARATSQQPATSAAPPPAAAPPSPPASPPQAASVNPTWQGALSAWLQQHKTYPEAARNQGQQGSVGLRFTVSHDGLILNVVLSRSSGSDILDAAAVALLRGARVPPFPAEMQQPTITVTVAIRYTIDR